MWDLMSSDVIYRSKGLADGSGSSRRTGGGRQVAKAWTGLMCAWRVLRIVRKRRVEDLVVGEWRTLWWLGVKPGNCKLKSVAAKMDQRNACVTCCECGHWERMTNTCWVRLLDILTSSHFSFSPHPRRSQRTATLALGTPHDSTKEFRNHVNILA